MYLLAHDHHSFGVENVMDNAELIMKTLKDKASPELQKRRRDSWDENEFKYHNVF